jgi:hypothetical protein
MSGRKGNLLKFQNITSASMGANVTSAVTNIQFLDNVGIQLNFTTSDAIGTFKVQISMDYDQDAQGVVKTAGNWVDLVLSPIPAAAGANDQIYIDINQISAPWIRVFYERTSGTGTLNGFVTGKML